MDTPIKTAMRLPVALRRLLKATAALHFPSVNALYVKVLQEFLSKGQRAKRREWLKPQALTTAENEFCQVPLHIAPAMAQALTAAATKASVSVASLCYTAMAEFLAGAAWAAGVHPTAQPA